MKKNPYYEGCISPPEQMCIGFPKVIFYSVCLLCGNNLDEFQAWEMKKIVDIQCNIYKVSIAIQTARTIKDILKVWEEILKES